MEDYHATVSSHNAGEEFFFTITETFWPDRSGADHKLTFSAEPPVNGSPWRPQLPGVRGSPYVQPHVCTLHTLPVLLLDMHMHVHMPG